MIDHWIWNHPVLAFFIGFILLMVGWYCVFALVSWSIPDPLFVWNTLMEESPR